MNIIRLHIKGQSKNIILIKQKIMKNFKTRLAILITGFFIITIGTTAVGSTVPATSNSLPYYIESDSPALKALLGVNHEFNGVFSTELGSVKLGLLEVLKIKTERVQIYQITDRPVCNDGICQGNEPKTCPQDCSADPGPEPERSCYPDEEIPWGINMVNGGSGGSGIMVAVLDTGVDTDHPDLVDNIEFCETTVTHFVPDAKDGEDKHGHGTHVAGTILANAGSDGLGIYGVAPEASLMAVKVCDRKGFCYGDDMATGIRYAIDSGANIISMSIGSDKPDFQVLSAIDDAVTAGILVVASAGNDGSAEGSIDYPGAYVKVIAVGAIDSTETVPYWSSRGVNDGDYSIEEREVEFGAPGVAVESTNNNGCYAYMSGTSMSAPHISGLAAKLWTIAGGNATAVRNHLQSIARDLHLSGDDTATGFGLPIAP